ncbi:hypothetical protein Sa4125_18230 [Aureimonas sp. SA4125]|uniref:hypothetical protein n=1 Tax=Aureimonas sp. SA4125 TaxID=2826993 RepID=UPI001CC57145|nr:hypothetical protein [Aureimonas sp. SA4125]BDA84281.1 hypothetical protein Sa4125_18230 [Aureimonas sp. SA4125]
MHRIFAVGLPGLLLAGCAGQPIGLTDLAAYTSAADPGVRTAEAGYSNVIGAYTPRNPVSPNGWRGTGVEVAPLASPTPEASPEKPGSDTERTK